MHGRNVHVRKRTKNLSRRVRHLLAIVSEWGGGFAADELKRNEEGNAPILRICRCREYEGGKKCGSA